MFWTKDLATHCPKMKMNGKKLSKFQFYFSGLLIAYPMLKNEKNVSVNSWGNPIYPISDPDGQDQGLIFLGENVDFL